MKIKYQFADETIEIEVANEWGDLLIDFDRQEYNVNHKETRRHASLSSMDYEGEFFADDTNLEELVTQAETAEVLRTAVAKLKPQQQELMYALYLSGLPLSQAEYAKQLGISETSVQQNARRVKAKLREILKDQKNIF